MVGYLVFVPQSQSPHLGQEPKLQHRVLGAKRTQLKHLKIDATPEDICWFRDGEPADETSQALRLPSSAFKLGYKVPALK